MLSLFKGPVCQIWEHLAVRKYTANNANFNLLDWTNNMQMYFTLHSITLNASENVSHWAYHVKSSNGKEKVKELEQSCLCWWPNLKKNIFIATVWFKHRLFFVVPLASEQQHRENKKQKPDRDRDNVLSFNHEVRNVSESLNHTQKNSPHKSLSVLKYFWAQTQRALVYSW